MTFMHGLNVAYDQREVFANDYTEVKHGETFLQPQVGAVHFCSEINIKIKSKVRFSYSD